MLKINASLFNILSEFIPTFCAICQQTSECSMQRMMLAAVHATEEWLIAPWCLMQTSAHVAFSYTKRVLFAL